MNRINIIMIVCQVCQILGILINIIVQTLFERGADYGNSKTD